MIGYDDNKVVGLRLYRSVKRKTKMFSFIERERNGYIRIGSRDFVKYLATVQGWTCEVNDILYG